MALSCAPLFLYRPLHRQPEPPSGSGLYLELQGPNCGHLPSVADVAWPLWVEDVRCCGSRVTAQLPRWRQTPRLSTERTMGTAARVLPWRSAVAVSWRYSSGGSKSQVKGPQVYLSCFVGPAVRSSSTTHSSPSVPRPCPRLLFFLILSFIRL